jgi:uncharacterized membrane protein YqgA involved in biofilm formation
MRRVIGAILNTGTVLLGSTTGLLLGRRLPDRFRQLALRALGGVTLVVGVSMIIGTRHPLVPALSLGLGMAIGTVLGLQRRLEQSVRRVLDRTTQPGQPARLAEGFLTTSLLFCVGPMTIVGSVQDGLTGDYRLIAVKALLDGVASLAFAAALGWGVMLSAATVLVVQGSITLGAHAVSDWFTAPAVAELTATGGVLVVAIGAELVGWKKLPVADYLPAVLLAPVLAKWLL